MFNPEFWSMPRTAGAFLVVAVAPLTLGVLLFFSRNGIQGGSPGSPVLFVWERGSILTAVILTALGFILLEGALSETAGGILMRLGATTYFFGAILLVAAEVMGLPFGGARYPLVVVYVVLAFLGQAAIGGALLQIDVWPPWIGWATIAWNLGMLVLLTLTTPEDIYFPALHHVMPLLIGLPLLWRG